MQSMIFPLVLMWPLEILLVLICTQFFKNTAKINKHTPLVRDPSLICMEQMSVFLQGKHREHLTFPCNVSQSTKPEI